MVFTTIHPAAGLSGHDYRRALRTGPRAVSLRKRRHRHLLKAAGFVDLERSDVTAEYREALRAFIVHDEKFAEENRSLHGAGAFDQRQADRGKTLAAIDEGLLRRSLFVVRRPG